jgi:hypothetical protein
MSSALPLRTSSDRDRWICRGYLGYTEGPVFLFFSNNLGCGGSLLVSAVVTLILLLLFGVIELG